jgi:hypothetical protein
MKIVYNIFISIFVLIASVYSQEKVTVDLRIPETIKSFGFVPVLLTFENHSNHDIKLKKPTVITSGLGGVYIDCYSEAWLMGIFHDDSLLMHYHADLIYPDLTPLPFSIKNFIVSFHFGIHIYNIQKMLNSCPKNFVLRKNSKKKIRALIFLNHNYDLINATEYKILISYLDKMKNTCYTGFDTFKYRIE